MTSGSKILIAEDEVPLAKALELKLKGAGFEVGVVNDGQEAIEALSRDSYSLVLTDLIMPRVDGWGLLEHIQKNQPVVPVIVLSNLGQDEDRERAAKLGASGYYVKADIQLSEVVAEVQKLLQGTTL